MKINISKFTREEWLAERTKLIRQGKVGGSDIGTLLGYNPWKSSIELFYEAIGLYEPAQVTNENMIIGTEVEPVIRKLYEFYEDGLTAYNYENNLKTRAAETSPYMYVTEHMFSNVDGIITKHPVNNTKGVLEIKNVSGYHIDMYKSGIPRGYEYQLQSYMMNLSLETGKIFDWGEFAFLVDGHKLEVIPIDADNEMWEEIAKAAADHHTRVNACIEAMAGKPRREQENVALSYHPEIDDTMAYEKFLKDKLESEEVLAGDDMFMLAVRYQKMGQLINKIKAAQQGIKNEIISYMYEHSSNVILFKDSDSKISYKKRFSIKL